MFLIGNFLSALTTVLDYALSLYMIIIIVRALISWVSPDPYNPIVRFLYAVTEPVLSPIRRMLPFTSMGIDFSPIIVFLVIIFLKGFVVASLTHLAFRLKF